MALRGCAGPSPMSSVLAVVQRCQVHKWRNVIGHLPERLHASVGKALRDAWNLDSADRAARVLKRLAGSLEHDHPGAAASIREGLDETLTVQRLGLTGALQRTLRTTNIIENLNGSVEHYLRNVKRWGGGQMIQRISRPPGCRGSSAKFLALAAHPCNTRPIVGHLRPEVDHNRP